MRTSMPTFRARSLCTVVLALVALAASPAFAGARDGRRAIDAVCVPIGCFPGDLPDFPVEITSPGSYILTSDLSVAGESMPETRTAIVIATSAVDLDLGGFALRGPTICQGDPLACSPVSNLGVGVVVANGAHSARIHDGTITGFGAIGADIHGAMTTLRRLRLTHNGDRGVSSFALGAQLSELVVNRNGGRGIYLSGAGSSVRDSSVSDNIGGGIEAGAAAAIDLNVVSRNHSASAISVGVGANISGNIATSVANGIEAQNGSAVLGNSVWAEPWQLLLGAGSAYTGNVMYWTDDTQWVSGGMSMNQNLCDESGC